MRQSREEPPFMGLGIEQREHNAIGRLWNNPWQELK